MLSLYSNYLSHSHTLSVFSPKLSTPLSFSPTHHWLHLRHYPSPAPPFTGAIHHQLHLRFFFFFGNTPLLLSAPPFLGHLHCHQLIHRLLVLFFFFPFYCQVGYLFGFLLRLDLAWLLLWAAVDGWDRL